MNLKPNSPKEKHRDPHLLFLLLTVAAQSSPCPSGMHRACDSCSLKSGHVICSFDPRCFRLKGGANWSGGGEVHRDRPRRSVCADVVLLRPAGLLCAMPTPFALAQQRLNVPRPKITFFLVFLLFFSKSFLFHLTSIILDVLRLFYFFLHYLQQTLSCVFYTVTWTRVLALTIKFIKIYLMSSSVFPLIFNFLGISVTTRPWCPAKYLDQYRRSTNTSVTLTERDADGDRGDTVARILKLPFSVIKFPFRDEARYGPRLGRPRCHPVRGDAESSLLPPSFTFRGVIRHSSLVSVTRK